MTTIDIGTLAEHPQFGGLEVYGTREEPLFPVQQVAHLIGVPRIRVDQGNYELGLDYIRMIVPRRDGRLLEQNLLTEQGLYNVVFRSGTALGVNSASTSPHS
jgi:hypothetical protein